MDTSTLQQRDDALGSFGKTRDALYAVDSEQRIIYWNEGARKLLGYTEQEVLGKLCWRIISGRRGNRKWCQRNCRIHRCVMCDVPPPRHYFETKTKKGQAIWVAVSVLIAKVEGKPISAHVVTSVPREERLRQTVRRMQGSVQIEEMPAVLAEHFGTFTLEPTIQDGEPVYLAHGKVDFFGDEAMARTGGAGGPDCTVRSVSFCLPVAA